MSEMKKVTLEDIVAKKTKILDGKNKTVKIFVESLEGYVVAKMPDRKLVADAMEQDNGMDSNVHLVSYCIVEPDLRDKDTQKAFKVHTHKELLQTILNDGEIGFIAEQIMDVAGYKKNTVKLVDELKN